MAGLDYWHTCSTIDANIKDVCEMFRERLKDFAEEIEQLTQYEQKDIIDGYVDYMYRDVEDYFENVRSTNEDMRKEADHQINRLEDDLCEANGAVEDCESRIAELERQIDHLEDQVYELESNPQERIQ
jgi:chromosome segregation ATPase